MSGEKVIDLEMDVDGVFKAKPELRRDVKMKKKVERALVNKSSKIQQFLFGLETGAEIFIKLNKEFRR